MSVFADMTDRHQPSIEPSNVVTLSSVKEERDRLEGVVRDYCTSIGLTGLPAQGVVEIALAMWRNGASSSTAYEEGRITADLLAAKMKPIRARLGLRDDDDPTPPARAA
jgi:hypothetical protein